MAHDDWTASHWSLWWWLNLGGKHEFITEVWFVVLVADIWTPSPLIHLTVGKKRK